MPSRKEYVEHLELLSESPSSASDKSKLHAIWRLMNHDSHVFALEFEPLREDCYNFSIVIGNSIQKLRNIVIVQEKLADSRGHF